MNLALSEKEKTKMVVNELKHKLKMATEMQGDPTLRGHIQQQII